MSSRTSEASGPPSPCRRQCCLDNADICLGCGRSLAEILEWGKADAPRREAICASAQARLLARAAGEGG